MSTCRNSCIYGGFVNNYALRNKIFNLQRTEFRKNFRREKMKRFLVVLVALMTVFAMIGCTGGSSGGKKTTPVDPGPGPGPDPTPVEVFKMSTDVFAKLELGAVSKEQLVAASDGWLDLAGSPGLELKQSSPRFLEVKTNAGWGAGIDLVNEKFKFQVDDKITVKFKAVTDAEIVFISSTAGAGETTPKNNVEAGDEFELSQTLTAAHIATVSTVSGSSPAAFRIGAKQDVTFQILEIIVERLEAGPAPEAVKVLTLADNFEYGDGYQGNLDGILKKSVNLTDDIAGKIENGDKYTLKITFTIDRELEDDLEIGLVDRTAPTYWTPLSWVDGNNQNVIDKDEINAAFKGGKSISKTLTLTTLAAASGTADNANCLTFQTEGAGNKGTAGSGVKGPAKLSFTVFEFAKSTGGAEPEPTPQPFEITTGIEFGSMGDASKINLANNVVTVTADGGNGFGFHYTFPATPGGIAWDQYSKIVFNHDLEITSGTGTAKVTLKKGANSWTDTAPASYPAFGNNGEAATNRNLEFNLSLFEGSNGLSFQHNDNGNSNVTYKITFNKITFVP